MTAGWSWAILWQCALVFLYLVTLVGLVLYGSNAYVMVIAHRRYRRPLLRDLQKHAPAWAEAEIVLLGSIASPKYVQLLTAALGSRIFFPSEFVGRGDMSRGGLMLRCVQEGRELAYVPLVGAQRRGPRPARLPPLARTGAR